MAVLVTMVLCSCFRGGLDTQNSIVIVSFASESGKKVARLVETDWANLERSVNELDKELSYKPRSHVPRSRTQTHKERCESSGVILSPSQEHTQPINCSVETKSRYGNLTSDEDFHRLMQNCSGVFQFFNTIPRYTSTKEEDFPLAFVQMLIYKEGLLYSQYMRQLAHLYRHHNVYCVHVDGKAPQSWHSSTNQIARCFPNVKVVPSPVKMWYQSWSLLQAQLSCYELLVELVDQDWEYGVTLKGVELPLLTNREMVEYFKAQKGRSVLTKSQSASDGFSQQSIIDDATYEAKLVHGVAVLTDNKQEDPPSGLVLYRTVDELLGAAITRSFAEFMLDDYRAIALREYLKHFRAAEDFFYQTVNSLSTPEAPGHTSTYSDPIISRNLYSVCSARYTMSDDCTAKPGHFTELSQLSVKKKSLFFHKYLAHEDDTVMSCLEEVLLNRNTLEYKEDCWNGHDDLPSTTP